MPRAPCRSKPPSTRKAMSSIRKCSVETPPWRAPRWTLSASGDTSRTTSMALQWKSRRRSRSTSKQTSSQRSAISYQFLTLEEWVPRTANASIHRNILRPREAGSKGLLLMADTWQLVQLLVQRTLPRTPGMSADAAEFVVKRVHVFAQEPHHLHAEIAVLTRSEEHTSELQS